MGFESSVRGGVQGFSNDVIASAAKQSPCRGRETNSQKTLLRNFAWWQNPHPASTPGKCTGAGRCANPLRFATVRLRDCACRGGARALFTVAYIAQPAAN